MLSLCMLTLHAACNVIHAYHGLPGSERAGLRVVHDSSYVTTEHTVLQTLP